MRVVAIQPAEQLLRSSHFPGEDLSAINAAPLTHCS